ncbi:MAG: SIS domain-containing protein [Actinobacteria bacterium]|nr:SIS domain-containing protein [Actinomycetota bacterium]
MRDEISASALWRDVCDMPGNLQESVGGSSGIEALADRIVDESVRRIVAVGNGASYYVAQALWLAALAGERCPKEVVAVPSGLVARGTFRWRDGDLLLAISSSGEFRDIVEAIDSCTRPAGLVTVTAEPDSTVARASDAVAVVFNPTQRAATHTQAFCGAVAVCLAIWARVSRDNVLGRAVEEVPTACRRAILATSDWCDSLPDVETPTALVTYGTGPAWAAALESALLIKEVARIPCEGVETREGATATMTGLSPGHLVLSLPTGASDPLVDEADEMCIRQGATVLRAPGGAESDRRLAAITTFPAALALSVELALRGGYDPDQPEWIEAYYATARRA